MIDGLNGVVLNRRFFLPSALIAMNIAPSTDYRGKVWHYLLLLGGQTLGALIIIRYALPLYRAVIADPAAHRASDGPVIWTTAAVMLMQTAFWLRHYLRPPMPKFRSAVIGYVILFLSRMSFLLAGAIFGFVFITQEPALHIPISRYLLTLAGLFAWFCYTQEIERLTKTLIESRPTPAD